jgi:putative heme degradation protein
MNKIIEAELPANAAPEGLWSLPDTTIEFVLDHLAGMGRVMVIATANGVTHERIGIVEKVTINGSMAQVQGDAQDCVIDLAPIAKVTLDLTSVMKGKSYPRVNFLSQDDKVLFAIVGFDGKEPFITPFLNSVREPLAVEEKQNSEKAELEDSDPAHLPFNQALETNKAIIVQMQANNITQRWQGVVEKIVPAMGFMNIMTGDFHLHLKGGVVSAWKTDERTYHTLDKNAEAIGLTVEFAE